MRKQIPLSATETAFLVMIQEEHAALIRAADQRRNNRLAPLFRDKQIPDGTHVSAEVIDGVQHLTYDAPDIQAAEQPTVLPVLPLLQAE